MSEHIALIFKKLDHLARMREYLRYSNVQAAPELLSWHEQLASFCQATYAKK